LLAAPSTAYLPSVWDTVFNWLVPGAARPAAAVSGRRAEAAQPGALAAVGRYDCPAGWSPPGGGATLVARAPGGATRWPVRGGTRPPPPPPPRWGSPVRRCGLEAAGAARFPAGPRSETSSSLPRPHPSPRLAAARYLAGCNALSPPCGPSGPMFVSVVVSFRTISHAR